MENVAGVLFGFLYVLVLLVFILRAAKGSFLRHRGENAVLLGLIAVQLLLLDADGSLKMWMGLFLGLVYGGCFLWGQRVRQRE